MLILFGFVMLKKHFNNNLDNNTLFGIIYFGYSNTIISVKYIKHFNKITAKSTVGKYKMLIFDVLGLICQTNSPCTVNKTILFCFNLLI
jgi:hypothetical protein